ncbi:MAG: OmpA family protein [Spirochaetaceae bacterium]|jgi:outer membrane protein OmpA-like peptidoglycan-associated protein|nr:OmpA family protein [Spirochaetaceae bacterium]
MRGFFSINTLRFLDKWFPKRFPLLAAPLWAAALALTPPAWGEVFFYQQKAGDQYRVLSTVHESVYLDRKLSHRAEILNRIAVTVEEESGGRARHRGQFRTAERAIGQGGESFQWARDYESVFERDRQGHITIGGEYFMPVVRNVPVFPERDLKPGDVWSAEGHEMHDFRDSFGINEPYRIPFTANYTYLGTRVWRGTEYPAFSVSYRVFDEPEAVPGRIWPRRIMEASDQVVYWDFELGQARAYEEKFRVIFELSNGSTVEYRGEAEAEILEASRMDKERLAGEIQRDLDTLGMGDTPVRVEEDGITISLENIQFDADSPVLLPGETAKLDKIGEILRKYQDRDILVGGHTALAGTEAGRRRLSGERASAVADYLIQQGVRTADRIVVRGFGAERPLGDNRTEAGRRRNRRVEITILEN